MTNPKGKRWWCFSENVFDNMKTATLPGDDFKGWCHLITLAQRLDEEGLLPTIGQISFAMRYRGDNEVISLLERLVERGLIDRKPGGERGVRFFVHDFSEWQGSSRPSKDKFTKSPTRAREPTYLLKPTNLPTAREARQGQDGISDFEITEKAKEREPPHLVLRAMVEMPSAPEPVVEPPASEEAAKTFAAIWTGYLEFGDPRSPRDKAEAVWITLDKLEQYAATEGFVIWALLEGIAKRAEPDRKCKYLDTWLIGRLWTQYSPKDHPKFAGTAQKLSRRWWRLDEHAKQA